MCGFVGLKTLRERATGSNVKKSKSKKLKSGHLCQVLTYIEHLSATTGPDPTGLLLYASVGEDWRLEYRLRGQRLLVRTLDFDRDWQAIHRDLLAMTGELAGTPDRLSA